jgi:hypothetical protein
MVTRDPPNIAHGTHDHTSILLCDSSGSLQTATSTNKLTQAVKLLLALTSTMILDFGSAGTHDHILLSDDSGSLPDSLNSHSLTGSPQRTLKREHCFHEFLHS